MAEFINGMPAQRWMRLEAKRSGYAKEGSGATTVRTQDRISVARLVERGSAQSANSEAVTAEQKLTAAKGALTSIRDLLVEARDIATSANDVGADRAELTTEANDFISQANQILKEASFDGKKLFDPDNPEQKMRLAVGGGGAFSVGLADVSSTPKPNLAKVEWSQVLASTGGVVGTGTFSARTAVSTGSSPRSVTAADLNGDGNLDLVGADGGSNTVSILLGNGNGTFQTRSSVSVGTNPWSVTSADLNGDGKLDLVTADSGSNTASILLGNGNGTFQPRTTVSTGTFPYSVKTADLNNDGKLDLVTADQGANTASIFLGNGNGTFQARTTVSTGTTPSSVTTADLNGDGKLDLVTSDRASNTASIFLGNGNGTFQARTTVSTGSAPGSVITADLNSDGNLDLISADGGASTASIFLGNGNGTFQARTTLGVGLNPYSVAAADLNGDGKLDLVSGDNNGNTASILLGNGNGTFQARTLVATGTDPLSITTADLNRDGAPDLITADANSNALSVFLAQTTQRSSSNDVMWNLTTAPDGSIYGTGWSGGNFGGVTNRGSEDAFVAKYSASGSTIWTRMLGSEARDRGYEVTADADGSVYVAGVTEGPTFEGQSIRQSRDVFVSKFNADGSTAWSKLLGTIGSTANFDNQQGIGLAKSSDGSLYVSYLTYGSFDGQTFSGGGAPSNDSFVTRLNTTNGSTVWTRIFGGDAASGRGHSVAVGGDGEIYVVGNENFEGFLTKFNQDGSTAWSRIMSAENNDPLLRITANDVMVGEEGSIYVQGQTRKIGTGGEQSPTYLSSFVTKYYADGTTAWTTSYETSGQDRHLVQGKDGSLYVSGGGSGTLDGQSTLGGSDAFVKRIASDGVVKESRLIRVGDADLGLGMTVGLDGSLYLGGQTTALGATTSDAFLMKLSPDSRKSLTSYSAVDLTTTTYANSAVSKLNAQIAAIESRLRGVNLGLTRSKAAQKYSSSMVSGFDTGIQATAPVTVTADELSSIQSTATERKRSIAEIKQSGKRVQQNLLRSVARGGY